MLRRILILGIPLLASVGFASEFPSADDIIGGGLGTTTTTEVTETEVYRVFEMDPRELDEALAALEALLEEAYTLFAQIVDKAERTVAENGVELASVVFHHWDHERFKASQDLAASLALVMEKARGKVEQISSYFDTNAAHQPEMYSNLLSRHAQVLEAFTLYNTVVDWGTSRSLDYDTAWPFDERDSWILRPSDFPMAVFPPHPRIEITGRAATRTRTHARVEGTGVVSDETVLAHTRTVFRQGLDPAMVSPWIEKARAHAATAQEAKSAIRRLGPDEGNSTSDFSKKRLLLGSQEDFDRAKSLAQGFALSMARLKGARNGALSLLTGSDLMTAEPNLRAGWEEVSAAYTALAKWGDGHFLQFDKAFKVIERNHRFFQQDLFATRHLFEAAEVPAPPPPPASAGTGSGASLLAYSSVYDTIATLPIEQRYNMAQQLIPRVSGLTLYRLSQFKELVYDRQENDLVSFGLKYVTQ